MTTTNTIPRLSDLDTMGRDELMNFWMRFQNRCKRSDAAAIVGDKRHGYTTISARLGAYAANRAAALGCRADGNEQGAEVYEIICESIFRRLPADLRWRPVKE